MIESIRTFFEKTMAWSGEEAGEVTNKDIRLAACALLLELAYADDDFSEEERQHLEGAIRRQYGLDKEQADRLIRLAEQERALAVDLWQFTKLIADNYSFGQKMVLAEIMWGLVYSDGQLGEREDYLMRKMSHLLGIEAGYLTEAKRSAMSQIDNGDGEGD